MNDEPIESANALWQSHPRGKRSVIQTLLEHEPELRAAGSVHLRVFGSVARDEFPQI